MTTFEVLIAMNSLLLCLLVVMARIIYTRVKDVERKLDHLRNRL